MVMNLYILFFVSLPEAFLNIIIILLFVGAKEKLQIKKSNIIRFTITLVAMLISSYLIRPLAPNVVVNLILHSLAYILIFKSIYLVNFTNITLSVAFMILLYPTIENTYLPFIINYLYKGIEDFSLHYHLFAFYSLPNRIFQLLLIYFLWTHQILLVTKINRNFYNYFTTATFILVITEYMLSYLYFSYFNIMSLVHQISLSISLLLLVCVFNFLVFKFIYVVIGNLITNGYNKYKEFEENAEFALDEIQHMLKNDKVYEAISLIDQIKGNEEVTNN